MSLCEPKGRLFRSERGPFISEVGGGRSWVIQGRGLSVSQWQRGEEEILRMANWIGSHFSALMAIHSRSRRTSCQTTPGRSQAPDTELQQPRALREQAKQTLSSLEPS